MVWDRRGWCCNGWAVMLPAFLHLFHMPAFSSLCSLVTLCHPPVFLFSTNHLLSLLSVYFLLFLILPPCLLLHDGELALALAAGLAAFRAPAAPHSRTACLPLLSLRRYTALYAGYATAAPPAAEPRLRTTCCGDAFARCWRARGCWRFRRPDGAAHFLPPSAVSPALRNSPWFVWRLRLFMLRARAWDMGRHV